MHILSSTSPKKNAGALYNFLAISEPNQSTPLDIDSTQHIHKVVHYAVYQYSGIHMYAISILMYKRPRWAFSTVSQALYQNSIKFIAL